ncbi:MAG: hypothetical protein JO317_09580, partial [Verrucomicrobiae bacterium]|nr:hypothetical protein [Verrucomicrobiae bacterium]
MSTFRWFGMVLLASLTPVLAQVGAPSIVVKDVNLELSDAPRYVFSGGTHSSPGFSSSKKWVVIEAVFDTFPEWTDEATFEAFALVKGPAGMVNLEGKAVFQDIEKGTGHKVAFFMTPQTFRRYTQTATLGAVQDVAIKVTYKGAQVDLFSKRLRRSLGNQRWWEMSAPS